MLVVQNATNLGLEYEPWIWAFNGHKGGYGEVKQLTADMEGKRNF